MSKHQTTAYKSDFSVQKKRETQSQKFTQPFVVLTETKFHHKTKKPVQLQIVSGAKRIWGTLMSSTKIIIIKNLIVHLIKIETKSLLIKCRFKTLLNGQIDGGLCCMEKKNYESHWKCLGKVSVQTSLRLETCSKHVEEFDVTLHMPNYFHINVDDIVKLTTHDIVKAYSSPKIFTSKETTSLSTCNSYTLLVLSTSNVG